jgi:energy-coupling factor transporter transmembrane protein EcfT
MAEEKNVEEATPTEESKGKSSWMDNTTLIVFVGVILFGVVLWFSGNIYLGLATFALTLFFGKSVVRRFR